MVVFGRKEALVREILLVRLFQLDFCLSEDSLLFNIVKELVVHQ